MIIIINMSSIRIEYKRVIPKRVYTYKKPYIVYTLSLNNWDSYSTFSEESRPDSIS